MKYGWKWCMLFPGLILNNFPGNWWLSSPWQPNADTSRLGAICWRWWRCRMESNPWVNTWKRPNQNTSIKLLLEQEIPWIIEKAKELQKNIYFCFIDYAKAFGCVDHNKLWKILQEMGIPDHVTCLLRNLYTGQEATVRTGHGTTDWFQIGKGVCQGCILSPSLFNLYAEYIMRNTGLEET